MNVADYMISYKPDYSKNYICKAYSILYNKAATLSDLSLARQTLNTALPLAHAEVSNLLLLVKKRED